MLQDFKSVSEEGACISIGEEDDSPHIPPTNSPFSAPCNDITKVSPICQPPRPLISNQKMSVDVTMLLTMQWRLIPRHPVSMISYFNLQL